MEQKGISATGSVVETDPLPAGRLWEEGRVGNGESSGKKREVSNSTRRVFGGSPGFHFQVVLEGG